MAVFASCGDLHPLSWDASDLPGDFRFEVTQYGLSGNDLGRRW